MVDIYVHTILFFFLVVSVHICSVQSQHHGALANARKVYCLVSNNAFWALVFANIASPNGTGSLTMAIIDPGWGLSSRI